MSNNLNQAKGYTKIINKEDAELFINHIIIEKSINFHPDTPFSDYIDSKSGLPALSKEECDAAEKMLDECFDVCGDEVYEIGLRVFNNYESFNSV